MIPGLICSTNLASVLNFFTFLLKDVDNVEEKNPPKNQHKVHSSGAYLQVDDSVRADTFHGVELQVPLEVAGVEPGNGQTVAKASLRERQRSKSRSCSHQSVKKRKAIFERVFQV